MRYNQARMKYLKKKLEDLLPPLQEDERIYLNVPYMARAFASYSHCGFDTQRKLWFTGSLNANLPALIGLYGLNEATAEKAIGLLRVRLDELGFDYDENGELHYRGGVPRVAEGDGRPPQTEG